MTWPLAPWRPTPSTPFARRRAQTSTFTLPATAYFMTSSVSGSVKRFPATMRVSSPSFFWSAVAWGPPPWTMLTRCPSSTRARTSRATASISGVPVDLAADLHDDGLQGFS